MRSPHSPVLLYTYLRHHIAPFRLNTPRHVKTQEGVFHSSTYKYSTAVNCPSCVGRVPVRKLERKLLRHATRRPISAPHLLGAVCRDSQRTAEATHNHSIAVSSPSCVGMVPVMALSNRNLRAHHPTSAPRLWELRVVGPECGRYVIVHLSKRRHPTQLRRDGPGDGVVGQPPAWPRTRRLRLGEGFRVNWVESPLHTLKSMPSETQALWAGCRRWRWRRATCDTRPNLSTTTAGSCNLRRGPPQYNAYQ
jgi:hypothetical protein